MGSRQLATNGVTVFMVLLHMTIELRRATKRLGAKTTLDHTANVILTRRLSMLRRPPLVAKERLHLFAEDSRHNQRNLTI